MKPTYLCMAILLGLSGSATCPAAVRPDLAAYARIEAAELQANPGHWWARAVVFPDKIESPPAGLAKKLSNNVRHRAMKLAGAGLVWVPDHLTQEFQRLDPGRDYVFAGTVNHTDGRFHVIVDSCMVPSEESGGEQWTDSFGATPAAPAPGKTEGPPLRFDAPPPGPDAAADEAGVTLPARAVVALPSVKSVPSAPVSPEPARADKAEAAEKKPPAARAEKEADLEKRQQAVAKKKHQAAEISPKATDSGVLPEWMQPIHF